MMRYLPLLLFALFANVIGAQSVERFCVYEQHYDYDTAFYRNLCTTNVTSSVSRSRSFDDLSHVAKVEKQGKGLSLESLASRLTLFRYDMERLTAKHPQAAEYCSKIFVGTMYALQGVEYAGAFTVGNVAGVAAKYASQESISYAIEHGIDQASTAAAQAITTDSVLQDEFADTSTMITYAGLCAGSITAGKKLVGMIAGNSVKRHVLTGRLVRDNVAGKTKPLLLKGENLSARPTWRQSELDDLIRYRKSGQFVESQISFLNGQRCPYGTPGSIRVDNLVNGKLAVEMKNYNLATNVDGLVRDIAVQAIKHQQHLPQSVKQQFKIDTRGQVCSEEMKINIRNQIIDRSNGILTK